ncbi:NADH-quinone oxidoreductase subunit C [Streptomyces sp. NPDC021354]|uniref:NADH-quinone oxidoreductase subunit C n=1 Tax=Streptomyces sp. NPDC021354 TaxID=3154793 RepID=UPI0033DAE705
MTAPDDRNRPADAVAETAGAAAQPPVGWLPRPAAELFGEGAAAAEAYGLLTVDVPADAWIAALETARSALGCTYFDWLSAVDEPGEGFRVAAHVVALGPATAAAPEAPATPAVRGLLVRTTVPHDAPALPTATGVYAGAAWHERETHEMFGIDFPGHPHLAPLLLPDGFEGHPLRKDFVLVARVAKAWPGAKEPGESEAAHAPRRRQMLPPGVPDPNEWGPLKGQLPPAPARPARAARTAGAASAAGAGGERPARRARSASAGSAGQRAATGPETSAEEAARPARRARSASEGSASQQGTSTETAAGTSAEGAPGGAARPARRSRSASEGSTSQRAATGGQAQARPDRPAARPRSTDAPWHHARPARDEPTAPGSSASAEDGTGTAAEGAGEPPRSDASRPSQAVPGVESPSRGEAAGSAAGAGPKAPATGGPVPGDEEQPRAGAAGQADGPDGPEPAPGAGPAPEIGAEPPSGTGADGDPAAPDTDNDDPAGGTA